MNYKETLDWMFNKLPMYQTLGATAYREDITNTVLLAKHLGNLRTGRRDCTDRNETTYGQAMAADV